MCVHIPYNEYYLCSTGSGSQFLPSNIWEIDLRLSGLIVLHFPTKASHWPFSDFNICTYSLKFLCRTAFKYLLATLIKIWVCYPIRHCMIVIANTHGCSPINIPLRKIWKAPGLRNYFLHYTFTSTTSKKNRAAKKKKKKQNNTKHINPDAVT